MPGPRLAQSCSPGQFQCSTLCIPVSWVCDGEADCQDAQDEKDCEMKDCQDDEFRCTNGRCISHDLHCDQTDDCGDATDEQECVSTCSSEDFTCLSDGRCLPISWVCDGDDDCADGLDELHCEHLDNNCEPSMFQCKYSCIPLRWICDGEADCHEGTDEENCSDICNDDNYQCGSGECIPKYWQCDGTSDCDDASDENCTIADTSQCLQTQFECSNGNCVLMEYVCNGHDDCGDQSDENCGHNECDDDNGGCSHICVTIPTSYRCECPLGFSLGLDNHTCQDTNECIDSFGICSHECANTLGSYQCSCKQGYLLEVDGVSCKATGSESKLIFTDKSEVRIFSLHSQLEYQTIVSGNPMLSALDFDWMTQHIYYANLTDQSIYEISLVEKTATASILLAGVGLIEGMSFDWTTKQIYFTKSTPGQIVVATLDKQLKVLIQTALEEPRAIVLDPEHRYMYWSDWGVVPKIEKAGMDGSDREVIVSQNLMWPNGLTIDYATGRLFWTDGKLKLLESCDLAGKDRQVVKEIGLLYPFALTVFENNVYWSDSATNTIHSAHKYTGHNDTVILATWKPRDVKVFHELRQPRLEDSNVCLKDGAPVCSHFCLLSPMATSGFVCSCPEDLYLNSNGNECIALSVIYTDHSAIHVLTWPAIDNQLLPIETALNSVLSFDIDWTRRLLYWTDVETGNLLRCDLDGKNVKSILTNEFILSETVRVDESTGNIYWTDVMRKTIEVISNDGSMRKIIIKDEIEMVRGLALYVEEG
uniref:Low-density lipoprotein receptor-related protein 1-like n=1 Tax=Saccoglossus kowalevskii TaxID=10224 RepID=A0ABM0MBZ7_SACKO|nr:PREDICTED: low-density lipoprotein receptor-related protein 1-like [Saccoglossus kowalevskii]